MVFYLHLLGMYQALCYPREPSSRSRRDGLITQPWFTDWHWGSGSYNCVGSWWQNRMSSGLNLKHGRWWIWILDGWHLPAASAGGKSQETAGRTWERGSITLHREIGWVGDHGAQQHSAVCLSQVTVCFWNVCFQLYRTSVKNKPKSCYLPLYLGQALKMKCGLKILCHLG